MTARSVGVLGSLCNPPHLGHLLLASEAAWQLGLDQVLLVPTGIPPHRDPPPESPELRTRLAAALVTCDPVLELCRLEVDRPGPAYTADTLEELAASGIGELVLLLGADQLAALHTWHDPERVRAAARIARAMVTRYGMSEKLGPIAFGEKEELIFLGREISEQRNYSDEIAAKIDAEVRAIIDAERLYR